MRLLREWMLKGLGLALLVAATFGGIQGAAQLRVLPSPDPLEGVVVREMSAPEVYVIHDKKKIHIPTPDALFALGYDWSTVRTMPDGALRRYPVFKIPSASPTPASLFYPPDHQKWFPVRDIPGAQRVMSRGKEVQIVELYGWLRLIDHACGDGEDFQYELEVDTDWALRRGINLHRLLRVGNIAAVGRRLPGFSPRRAVALPLIKVELDSWGRKQGDNLPAPPDWVPGNCGRVFPFDHYQPLANGPRLEPAPFDFGRRYAYVRVSGSLVTDSPHEDHAIIARDFSRLFAITRNEDDEWRGAVLDWTPGFPVSPDHPSHPARWIEVHSPDLIEVLNKNDVAATSVTTRGVALTARRGFLPFGLSNACEAVDFTMRPEGPRPAGWYLAAQELRGPETYLPWGQDANNGSWVTRYDDHIRVRARVCGGGSTGRPGLFKALYRVWWAPPLTNPGF